MSDHPSPRASRQARAGRRPSQPGQAAGSAGYGGSEAAGRPVDGHPVLRGLALAAVCAGVLVLAAAAFVLSYHGIHAVALQAGVSRQLARLYPVIFDAMLVIAGAAVLSLRGAGPISRIYAWLSLLALLAAAAGADTLHSTGTRTPHRISAATAAIVPWALLLIGFGLLLVMLRHARLRRAAAAEAAARAQADQPRVPVAALTAGPPAEQPPIAVPSVPAQAGAPDATAVAPDPVATAAPAAPAAPGANGSLGTTAELVVAGGVGGPGALAVAGELAQHHAGDPHAAIEWTDQYDDGTDQDSGFDLDDDPSRGDAGEERPTAPEGPVPPDDQDGEPAGAGHDAPRPAFHRMWSSPVPPDEDYES
jgi:hypothetical protein